MSSASGSPPLRIRDLGYAPGIHAPGPSNSILDVPGVHVSQLTVPTAARARPGVTARKGVTLLLPRPPARFHHPCHAGSFTFNGNGEVTGSRQVADWGYTNTPLALTNSLSLGSAVDAVWDWVLARQDGDGWDGLARARNYGTPVVGETADWRINCDLAASRVSREDLRRAFDGLKDREHGGEVQEGQFGGGAGMTCHMFAGGTGTASRRVGGGEGSAREYTLGVLVQTNYGHLVDLVIGGVPVGRILQKEKEKEAKEKDVEEEEGVDVHAPPSSSSSSATAAAAATAGRRDHHPHQELAGRTQDGSIVIIIMADAPLPPHMLNRVARHATVGLAQVGGAGIGRNFSGDIFLALSTAEHGPEQLEGVKMRHQNPTQTYKADVVKHESIDPYFYACAEAVEEAILNSMVGGREGVIAMDGSKVDGFPVERVKQILDQYLVKV